MISDAAAITIPVTNAVKQENSSRSLRTTLGEFVPGYEATGWQGIVAPKNTPTEIVDKLNEEIRAALSDAGFKFMWGLRGSFPVEIEAHITERD
jgi:Tripartite tricarboxylate transporter family receptor